MASRFGQQEYLDSYLLKDPSLNQSPVSTSWWESKQEYRDKDVVLREQLNELDEHVARLQNMLKSEQAKSSRLQLQCHHQEMELRRQEMHSNRLKEKLSQLTDRPKGKGPSIEVLNFLPAGKREHLSKPFWSITKQEEATLHLMLECRETELREAVKLRHSLTTLLHALRLDMEQSLTKTMDVDREGERRLDETEMCLGEHVTGGVVQSWRKVQKKLQDILCEGQTTAGTDHDKLIAQLESELKESQQLIRLQQQLLQDSLVSPLPLELSDSYFLEEWERLQMSWAELNHQRKTFARERQAFTDAAIRLGCERHDFDQQRACFMKQQYLCASPQSNSRRGISAFNFSSVKPMDTSGCLPISPSSTVSGNAADAEFSEGQGLVQTPSTPELYAALNLSYRSRDVEHQPEKWML